MFAYCGLQARDIGFVRFEYALIRGEVGEPGGIDQSHLSAEERPVHVYGVSVPTGRRRSTAFENIGE